MTLVTASAFGISRVGRPVRDYETQPISLIHFRLMAQLSLNCVGMSVSLPRGHGGCSKVASASKSETYVLVQLRES